MKVELKLRKNETFQYVSKLMERDTFIMIKVDMVIKSIVEEALMDYKSELRKQELFSEYDRCYADIVETNITSFGKDVLIVLSIAFLLEDINVE